MSNKRMRIGVVVSSLHESCQSLIWQGLHRGARTRAVDLVSFVATSQDRVDSLDMHFEVVRDFITRADLDGLVIFGGAMAEFTSSAFVEKFKAGLGQIPLVSLNHRLDCVPSIMANNTSGVVEMVDHFVNYHGYSNIVFVKGPEGHEEADERFEAYKTGLLRNSIKYNPDLVFNGTFSAKTGVRAVRSLFASGMRFDAVMCADDEIALGVMDELKKRGVHIPTDVAVAGFDDIADAALILPSLTTVKQPLFQMGVRAIDMVLQLVANEPVEDVTVMAATPVFRRSCGCFPSSIRHTVQPLERVSGDVVDRNALVQVLLAKVSDLLGNGVSADEPIGNAVVDIVDAFMANLHEQDGKNRFLNALDTYLFRVDGQYGDVESMHAILSALSARLALLTDDYQEVTQGNNLLQQAQVLLREHKLRVSQTRNMQSAAFQLKIRETAQKIITTFDQSRLLYTMKVDFPAININLFVFALYETRMSLTTERWRFPDNSRLVLGFDNAHNIWLGEKDGDSFASRLILPPSLAAVQTEPLCLIFMPLFFREEQFGYVVFGHEEGQPFFMYEELRLHIGSALKSSFMMRDLKIQSMVDEMTGLYNRRGFITLGRNMVESARQAGGRLLVFFADLDGLKSINDNLGHDAGDEAIKGAASVLLDTFRAKDIIGRIGGDEFTVILHLNENTEPESRIMLRLQDKVDDYNRYSGNNFTLSMSVGASYFEPDEKKSLEDILKEADNRMLAKKRKRYDR